MKIGQLSELQLDAIRELGNIGAGHAATALSQLTDNPIGISSPTLEIVPFSDVPNVFGGPERLVGAVFVKLLGDAHANMLFMADRDSSLGLVDMMRGRPPKTAKSFGLEEEKLLTHTASILIAAYAAAIGRMTDLSVLPNTPHFALDMAGAVLESVAIQMSFLSDETIFVRTIFTSEDASVDTALLFLPDTEALEVILGRLGVK
ncbi:MAG: chemotaxis protein CheC [Actinobacteria bacterium]|nr:chemotaxis protein CheC [Actinomycetota bacterium]MCL5887386.1 chemotaxis protein CheC [Actinomycetota bacterium]